MCQFWLPWILWNKRCNDFCLPGLLFQAVSIQLPSLQRTSVAARFTLAWMGRNWAAACPCSVSSLWPSSSRQSVVAPQPGLLVVRAPHCSWLGTWGTLVCVLIHLLPILSGFFFSRLHTRGFFQKQEIDSCPMSGMLCVGCKSQNKGTGIHTKTDTCSHKTPPLPTQICTQLTTYIFTYTHLLPSHTYTHVPSHPHPYTHAPSYPRFSHILTRAHTHTHTHFHTHKLSLTHTHSYAIHSRKPQAEHPVLPCWGDSPALLVGAPMVRKAEGD